MYTDRCESQGGNNLMYYLVAFMLWLIRIAVALFWVLDICNMPFMEIFDTTYPLNGLFWTLFLVLCECTGVSIKIKRY